MLSPAKAPVIAPMDMVDTALHGLRMALVAHYALKRGLLQMSLEVQNLITLIELDQATSVSDQAQRCQLLAAGVQIAAESDMAGSEHGQHILAMCRIALEAAARHGLLGREESRS